MKPFNRNKEKAEAMNIVRSYTNRTAPALIEALKAGFKVNQDGQLFKKDRKRLDAIIDQGNNRPRAFLRVSPYSIFLAVDLHYTDRAPDKNGVSSCSYYGLNTYIWGMSSNTPAEFEPYPLVTEQELTEAEVTLEKLQHEHREMGYKINQLKNFLGV